MFGGGFGLVQLGLSSSGPRNYDITAAFREDLNSTLSFGNVKRRGLRAFGGKFGHAKFSLPTQETPDIYIKSNFYANLRSALAFGSDLHFSARLNERVEGSVIVTRSLPFAIAASERLGADLRLSVAVPVLWRPAESLRGTLSLACDISIPLQGIESFGSRLSLGKDIWSKAVWSDAIESRFSIGKDIWSTVNWSEMLHSLLQIVSLELQVVRLNVTVPPGGRLYIDSANFTALLNNQNVLHQYNGDWVTLDPNLASIELDSGSGGKLQGNLIFTEAYL